MPSVITDLPFFDRPTNITVRGRLYPVKRDQIIVWISLSHKGVTSLRPDAARIPAILDIGCNHNFLIHQRHLIDWAGIHPGSLRRLVDARVAGVRVRQLAANVWLHANRPDTRDEFASREPFPLMLVPGIAVVPSTTVEDVYPRLPLLGLRAFRHAGMRIEIDCAQSSVTIRTRKRYWLFG